MTEKHPSPPILRNLDDIAPGAFYSTPPPPLQLGTKEVRQVSQLQWKPARKVDSW